MTNIIYVRRNTKPAFEPVSLNELKTHLKITHTDEDAYLESLVRACRYDLEQYTQRIWCQSQLTMTVADSGVRWIELPYAADNTSVDSVKINENGISTAVDSTKYSVSADYSPAILRFTSIWTPSSTSIYDDVSLSTTYTTGHATVSDIPDLFKFALMLYAAFLYENREAIPYGVASRNAPVSLPMVVQNLLMSSRVHGLLPHVMRG